MGAGKGMEKLYSEPPLLFDTGSEMLTPVFETDLQPVDRL
jgi:hypothetical protein